MKLKDLVNKKFTVTFSGELILFTKDDLDRVGENYEVDEQAIKDRMETVLYDEEVNIASEFVSSIKLALENDKNK